MHTIGRVPVVTEIKNCLDWSPSNPALLISLSRNQEDGVEVKAIVDGRKRNVQP